MTALPFETRLVRAPLVALRRPVDIDAIAQIAGLLLAVAFIGGFVIAAAFRASYPFPLQSTEPATLIEVERILRGQPLYVQPSLAYIPLIYGPVYFYVSAALAMVIGPTFAPLRLVSLAASIGTIILIGRLVQRETGSLKAALVAAGLYAASFPFSETGLDLGRVDALFTFFLLGAIYAARRAVFVPTQIGRSLAVSGCLLGLAALTKLPLGALPVGVALLISVAYAHRPWAAVYALAATVTFGAVVLILNGISGPWPTWYLWSLPQLHEPRPNLIGRFWFLDVLPRFSISLLLGPVFVLVRLLRRDLSSVVFYTLVASSMFILAWASRSSGGGAPNVLLPAFAVVAILLGLGLHAAVAQLEGHSMPARAFRAYLFGLCLVQFALLAYNPRITVPYRSDQWADERLAQTLAALPGPIFAADLDGYMHDALDSDHPMTGPMAEIQGSFGGPGTDEGRAIQTALSERFAAHRYRYIVLPEKACCVGLDPVQFGYREARPLFPPGDVFYEWKSWRTVEPVLYEAPG